MFNERVNSGPTVWAINTDGMATETLVANQYNLELSALDSLNNFFVSAIVLSLVTSAIVGSYYKSAVYRYMYNQIKTLGTSPIDIMILINSITQHFMCLVMVFTYSIGLGLQITISDFVDQAWCNVPLYAGIYGAS